MRCLFAACGSIAPTVEKSLWEGSRSEEGGGGGAALPFSLFAFLGKAAISYFFGHHTG